jgi:5-hydroxyisourate hydrolase-like protein (transthyretin family)
MEPGSANVKLTVFDILGNEIATLVNEVKTAGNYEVEFTSANELSSGIYFYRLQAGNFVESKKMLLLK